MKQLTLFPTTLRHAYLEADSAKKAWYDIVIEENSGDFRVVKRSGIHGKELDKRSWWMRSFDDAVRFFNNKIKQKINPRSSRQRIYNVIYYLW